MLNQMTLNRLHEMKLSAMAEKYRTIAASAAEGQLSFDEWFGLLVDAEWDHRHTNRIARLMKKATLYFPNASVEDIEYRSDRKLNRNLLQELGTCRYILDKRNVILMGATGAGKTYIACALGTAACRNLYTVKYIRLPDLLNELAVARGEDCYMDVMKFYRKVSLLILDEWMLIPLTKTESRDLLEIVEARYERSSTIFCSQFAPPGWHERIAEDALADAVLDRIENSSYKILIDGDDSMRKRKGFQSE